MCGTAPKKYFFLAVINLSRTDGVRNKRIGYSKRKQGIATCCCVEMDVSSLPKEIKTARVLEDKLAKQPINYEINQHAHENVLECFRTSF